MLSPDQRQTLLDGLRPDPEERLDAAVATTFTLDLAAALLPPLAFASHALRDASDPVAAMEAVRACNERVDVFCQAGQIRAPRDAVDLVAFLEPMLHEVRQPRPGHLFHPKLWLLRYVTGQAPRYRMLCLSRNLTDDHSWDAVLRLDGGPTRRLRHENEPLAALVRALPDAAVRPVPAARADRVRGLADEVRFVEWELPPGVEELAFHVFGVPGVRARADFTGSRHLVVSPFCTDGGLGQLTIGSGQRTVLSRAEELDRLAPATLENLRCFVLNGAAGLSHVDDSGDSAVLGGLHAKVYVVERAGRAHLFLGSANATDAALGGNVEILAELVGPQRVLGIDQVLGPSPSVVDLIEPYETAGGAVTEPEQDEARRLEEALRIVAQVGFTATITGADPFTLTVTTGGPLAVPAGTRLTVEPLTRPGEARWLADGLAVQAGFTGLGRTDVTPFLILRAEAGPQVRRSVVVVATLVGDPAGRHDEILARQIDTTEKFLRFLAALLGLTEGAGALLGVGGQVAGTGAAWHQTGLFELLVRGLADRPRAVADLDRLVERLAATDRGGAVLPDGFLPLWTTIRATLACLEAVPA